MQFFATAIRGTEGLLRDELRELRVRGVRADRGGVHFEGELDSGFSVCLWSRISVRVLLHIAQFEVASQDDFYEAMRGVEIDPFLDASRTLVVRATCRSGLFTNTQYLSQLTKDAIVDRLRDRSGARPNVDREDPDVMFSVRVVGSTVDVYVDLSGDALHRRGYRTDGGPAPLKENLAAAMIRYSGWDRTSPFIDPMCGSGTIAIEAWDLSRNKAPGLSRDRFGFERWACYSAEDQRRFTMQKREAKDAIAHADVRIVAADVDVEAVERTRKAARAAGAKILIEHADLLQRAVPGTEVAVTNPPWDERLETNATELRSIGRALRNFERGSLTLLCGNPALEQSLRLRPKKWVMVQNGPIDCKLLHFEADRARVRGGPVSRRQGPVSSRLRRDTDT